MVTQSIEEQIANFAGRCDDLLQAKFILAPSKIGELLCAVAASPALVSLFEKAVRGFDYAAAQQKYMLPSPDGTENKGVLLLPEDPMERMAFLFCLLVDIDNQDINFNLFLQTFFSGDGSYTEAFDLFLSRVVRPFRDAVCEELSPRSAPPAATAERFAANIPAAHKTKRSRKAVFARILPLIKAENADLAAARIGEEDKYAGSVILNEAYAAAKAADEKELKALLLGYGYFAAQTGTGTENIEQIFSLLGEL